MLYIIELIFLKIAELQTQTTLSALEIQQCLAFLSDHQLIIVRIDEPNLTPKSRLREDFNQKWAQMHLEEKKLIWFSIAE